MLNSSIRPIDRILLGATIPTKIIKKIVKVIAAELCLINSNIYLFSSWFIKRIFERNKFSIFYNIYWLYSVEQSLLIVWRQIL